MLTVLWFLESLITSIPRFTRYSFSLSDGFSNKFYFYRIQLNAITLTCTRNTVYTYLIFVALAFRLYLCDPAGDPVVLGPGDAVHRHLDGGRGDGLREARLRHRHRHQAPRAHRHTAAAAVPVHEGALLLIYMVGGCRFSFNDFYLAW